jgi:flavorubredoxin
MYAKLCPNTLSVYDYLNGFLFAKNLIGSLLQEQQQLEDHLKAVIEKYDDALINNKLMPK